MIVSQKWQVSHVQLVCKWWQWGEMVMHRGSLMHNYTYITPHLYNDVTA